MITPLALHLRKTSYSQGLQQLKPRCSRRLGISYSNERHGRHFIRRKHASKFSCKDPHLYYNGTLWQTMHIHDNTSGSFLTALPLYNQVHPKRVGNSSFCKKGRFSQNRCYLPDLDIATRLWASPFPHELQGRTCGRCKGLRFAVKDTYQLRGLKTSFCNTDYLCISQPSDITAMAVRDIL